MKRIARFLLLVLLVGLAGPTAASLLIRGAVAVAGFPFTLSGLTIQASSTNTTIPGISTASVTDPINDYNCSGTNTTTTGTMSNGSTSLTVGSAAGWTIGMGIQVPTAGSSGGAGTLITSVTNIVGTTFTLNDAAQHAAAGVTVQHDDTVCLQAAINSGKNVHLRLGNYNVSSELDITAPMVFDCEGAVGNGTLFGAPFTSNGGNVTGGTAIWNWGFTTNSYILNVSSGFVTIRNCAWQQVPGVSTGSGSYWLLLANGSSYIYHDLIENNVVYGVGGGILVNGHVLAAVVAHNWIWTDGTGSQGVVKVNNASPAGDIKWIGNEFNTIQGGTDLIIASADVESFIGNKFNGCDPCVTIGTGAYAQTFIGNSFEGSGGGNNNPLINISGSAGAISFVGGEVGLDNSHGAFVISGTSTGNIEGVSFSFIQGTPIANTSSGIWRQWGNIAGVTVPNPITETANDGTAAVACAGSPTSSFKSVAGVVTHC